MIMLDKTNPHRRRVCDWCISLGINPENVAEKDAVLTAVGEAAIDFTFIRLRGRSGHRSLDHVLCGRPDCATAGYHLPGDMVTVHLEDPPPFWQPSHRCETFSLAGFILTGGLA